MTDIDAYGVSYRTDEVFEAVIREFHGPNNHHETEFGAAELHSTLMDVREAVEDYERTVGHVRYVVLGAEEYEHVLMYGVLQQGFGGVAHLGGVDEHAEFDPHETVRDLIRKDVVVVPGSAIYAVGAETDELIRHIRGEDTDP